MNLTYEILDEMSQEDFDSLVENYDQLDELSKSTLKSYAQKANLQNNGYSVAAGQMIDRDKKASSAFMKKAGNRTVGVNRAINKLTKEDYDQLDELSKATLGSYIKNANRGSYWAGNEAGHHYALGNTDHVDRIEAKKTYAKRSKGIDKAVSRLTKEDVSNLVQSIVEGDANQVNALFNKIMASKLEEAIEDKKQDLAESLSGYNVFLFSEDFDINQLDEDAGSLKGLPPHIIKHLTNKYGQGAGKDSEVTKHEAKNPSNLNGHIKSGLEAGHAVAVHVNGKLHSVISSNKDAGYGRESFKIHTPEGQHSEKEYKWKKSTAREIKYGSPHVRKVEITHKDFNKGDSIRHATDGISDKEFLKNNKVEVHHIKSDKNREKLSNSRRANKPEDQHNYVKQTEDENNYYSDLKKTSTTSAGDRLKSIKDAAADKLARKKVSGGSAQDDAKKLHDELGKHLAAGNHREVKATMNKLSAHIDQHGLTNHEDKVKEYKSGLNDLKSGGSFTKKYAKERLAKLRGE